MNHELRKVVQIFISYARADVRFANFLYSRLKEAGFKPWMDIEDINTGELWRESVERALEESMFFIACLSTQSVSKRGYLQTEFRYSLEKWKEFLDDDIYFIPVRLDECEIPTAMSKFQRVDFFSTGEQDIYKSPGAWIRITQAITEVIKKRSQRS